MHFLFLDANAYLAFFNLSEGDIAQLRKLPELVKHQKLTILLPVLVKDEVRRNRAKVVTDRLKSFEEARLKVPIPELAVGSPDADSLKKTVSEAQRAHSALLRRLRAEASTRTLPADMVIAELFNVARVLSDTNAYDAATQRKNLGNPPGKGSSLGDAVNWELLLRQSDDFEDLCFVSSDPDFANPLDPNLFSDFLADEWSSSKSSSIHYYRDIKQFLDDKFPDIRLIADVRKYLLIDSLISSDSFSTSHGMISELLGYPSFSLEEAQRLLSGAMENSQVRWIASDDDMAMLLRRTLEPHRAALPKDLVDRWDYVIGEKGYAYGPAPTMSDIELDRELRKLL